MYINKHLRDLSIDRKHVDINIYYLMYNKYKIEKNENKNCSCVLFTL